MCDLVILGVCLSRPPADTASIFGFPEFLTALALLVLVFNSTDPLYKFRIAVAPLPLIPITFICTLVIGLGALINDLWFAQRWYAPALGVSKAEIQAALGSLFLTLVLVWTWFAFVRPPVFGRLNAKAFTRRLYWALVRGSDQELSAVAAELGRSGHALVRAAAGRPWRPNPFLDRLRALRWRYLPPRPKKVMAARAGGENPKPVRPTTAVYAREVLIFLANRKLCRHIVQTSPVTAMAIMEAAGKHETSNLPLQQFMTILNTESLRNPESVIYQEDGLYSGGMGQVQPYSKALYGNYWLVEMMDGLGIDYRMSNSFTPEQYEIYCHMVSVVLKANVEAGEYRNHSYALNRAFRNLEAGFSDLSQANGREDYGDQPGYQKLRLAMGLVRELQKLLAKRDDLKLPPVKVPENSHGRDVFDLLAGLIFNMIEQAAHVTGPEWTAWDVQHNSIWSSAFFMGAQGPVEALIQRKVERLAYEGISEFDKWEQYRSARLLGYFLNVFGFSPISVKDRRPGGSLRRYASPLRRYVLAWTRRNYLRLRRDFPDIAQACLMGSITFDEQGQRLVKSFRKSMDGTVPQNYLDLLPPPPAGGL